MSAQELQTLLLDGWKREVIRVSIADCDEKLICQLLCCEKPAQYGHLGGPDGARCIIICDADSLQHMEDRPQFSVIPPDPVIRQFIIWSCQSCRGGNAEARFWLHGYAAVALERNGVIESLPQSITPDSFTTTVSLM